MNYNLRMHQMSEQVAALFDIAEESHNDFARIEARQKAFDLLKELDKHELKTARKRRRARKKESK